MKKTQSGSAGDQIWDVQSVVVINMLLGNIFSLPGKAQDKEHGWILL
jgi:hypothetical protein